MQLMYGYPCANQNETLDALTFTLPIALAPSLC